MSAPLLLEGLREEASVQIQARPAEGGKARVHEGTAVLPSAQEPHGVLFGSGGLGWIIG